MNGQVSLHDEVFAIMEHAILNHKGGNHFVVQSAAKVFAIMEHENNT